MLSLYIGFSIWDLRTTKFQARKNLVAIFQTIVDKRRERRKDTQPTLKKDMMEALLDTEDENGRRLDDEEIIDILVMYLNAGHESSGHITMWATVFLQKHPEVFQKAKVPSCPRHISSMCNGLCCCVLCSTKDMAHNITKFPATSFYGILNTSQHLQFFFPFFFSCLYIVW